MVLVTLPGVMLGGFIGTSIVSKLSIEVIRSHHLSLSWLTPGMAGLIAGVGMGFLLKPGDQLFTYALSAFGVGFAAFILVFALTELRALNTAPRVPVSAYFTLSLQACVVAGAVALGLWRLKVRQP